MASKPKNRRLNLGSLPCPFNNEAKSTSALGSTTDHTSDETTELEIVTLGGIYRSPLPLRT